MPATATTTSFETLTVETSEHICTITLNRPKVYNAFNDQLTFELQDALKQAERDEDVRVIIITGEGKAFCSGQDLGDLKDRYVPGYVPEFGKDIDRRYNPIAKRIINMEKPSIAAINGVAAGAGSTALPMRGTRSVRFPAPPMSSSARSRTWPVSRSTARRPSSCMVWRRW